MECARKRSFYTFWQTVITNVDTVNCRKPCTAHVVWVPVAEGKVREIVLLHFLLRRQLRIEHLHRLAYSSFAVLVTDIAYTCVLNRTVRQ